MDLINGKDEISLSICVETPGRFESDLDSVEPNANCVFSTLSRQGYTSASAASDDDEDWAALDFLCGLVYPDRDISNKMRPCFLKLAPIARKCKFKVSSNLAHNVIKRG